jgi:peptidoglycan/xylan/chitin deacetylase (PgdA/CDA1 family)
VVVIVRYRRHRTDRSRGNVGVSESARQDIEAEGALADSCAAVAVAAAPRAGYWPYDTPHGPWVGDRGRMPSDAKPPVTDILYERYAGHGKRRRALNAYYALRPIIPRPVQLGLRRVYARRRRRRSFPAWPIEPRLVEGQYDHIRARLAASGSEALPFVNFWPDHRRFCVTLTHDVESVDGIANIPRVLRIEQRHGVRTAWNLCAEWYPIPDGLLAELRRQGCEVGLHGIRHDGKLFESRASFLENLPKIHAYLRRWEVDGFRSPATHRNADWMPELRTAYDSSFPDTDPFEPQPGGCCSIFPFFLGEMVELPITLPQDHTLLKILREASIDTWVRKSEWIMRHHGIITLITHPDYLIDDAALALYDRFLAFITDRDDAWYALPRDVARWWRGRASLSCTTVGGGPRVTGPDDEAVARSTVCLARLDGERVRFELA